MKCRFLGVLAVAALGCMMIVGPSPVKGEQYGGFGIVVSQLYDGESPNGMGAVVVLHVPPGSEAHNAGMQAGDIIFEIDGARLAGKSFADIVVSYVRGPVGSTSDLKIKRSPGSKLLEMRITRTLINSER